MKRRIQTGWFLFLPMIHLARSNEVAGTRPLRWLL
jgi:hypothetical protein